MRTFLGWMLLMVISLSLTMIIFAVGEPANKGLVFKGVPKNINDYTEAKRNLLDVGVVCANLETISANLGINYIIYGRIMHRKRSDPIVFKEYNPDSPTVLEDFVDALPEISYFRLKETVVLYDSERHSAESAEKWLSGVLRERKLPDGEVIYSLEGMMGPLLDYSLDDGSVPWNELLAKAKPGDSVFDAVGRWVSSDQDLHGCIVLGGRQAKVFRPPVVKLLPAEVVVNQLFEAPELKIIVFRAPYYESVSFWLPYYLSFESRALIKAISGKPWMDVSRGYPPIRDTIWNFFLNSDKPAHRDFLVQSLVACKDSEYISWLLKDDRIPKNNGEWYGMEKIKSRCINDPVLRKFFVEEEVDDWNPEEHPWPEIANWEEFKESIPEKLKTREVFTGKVDFPHYDNQKREWEEMSKTLIVEQYKVPVEISFMIPFDKMDFKSTPEMAYFSYDSQIRCRGAWGGWQKRKETGKFDRILYKLSVETNEEKVSAFYVEPYEFTPMFVLQNGEWQRITTFNRNVNFEVSVIRSRLNLHNFQGDFPEKMEKMIEAIKTNKLPSPRDFWEDITLEIEPETESPPPIPEPPE